MDTEVNLRISKHAYDRMKERLGMNRKAAQRIAQRALLSGIGSEETSGCLQRYIEARTQAYMRQGTKILIYGEAVYCFVCKQHEETCEPVNSLLTVMCLPNEFKNHALGIQRRLRKDCKEWHSK